MAIRLTKEGLQSYATPFEEAVRKKRKKEVIPSVPAPSATPAPTKKTTTTTPAESPSRAATSSERLELAQARAKRAGIAETDPKFPITEYGKEEIITTPEDVKQQQMEEAASEVGGELGELGLLEEPGVAQELKPGMTAEGIFPNVDIPSIEAIRTQIYLSSLDMDRIKEMGYEKFINNPEIVSDELLSKLITNEVDFEALTSGDAIGKSFGTYVESIPIVGSLARKYAGGLITTPSSQIDDIKSNLETIEGEAMRMREWLGSGYSPYTAAENLNRFEQDVDYLESKIKLLVIQSPELKSAPEEVATIQEDINMAKNVINNAKREAAEKIIERRAPSVDDAMVVYEEIKKRNERKIKG